MAEALHRRLWDILSEIDTGIGLTAGVEGNAVMSGESLFRLLDGFVDMHAVRNNQPLPRNQMACFGGHLYAARKPARQSKGVLEKAWLMLH